MGALAHGGHALLGVGQAHDELFEMLEMFFDRAIYYAAVGYEQELARAPHEAGVLMAF